MGGGSSLSRLGGGGEAGRRAGQNELGSSADGSGFRSRVVKFLSVNGRRGGDSFFVGREVFHLEWMSVLEEFLDSGGVSSAQGVVLRHNGNELSRKFFESPEMRVVRNARGPVACSPASSPRTRHPKLCEEHNKDSI